MSSLPNRSRRQYHIYDMVPQYIPVQDRIRNGKVSYEYIQDTLCN